MFRKQLAKLILASNDNNKVSAQYDLELITTLILKKRISSFHNISEKEAEEIIEYIKFIKKIKERL